MNYVRGMNPDQLDAGDVLTQLADDAGDQGEALHCTNCLHLITYTGSRTRVDGGHEHHFSNPQGEAFHIGCFRQAPGCRSQGIPTSRYSWFAGCRWSYAVCRGCNEHLGWYYTGQTAFYGLILLKLVPGTPPSS